MNIVKINTEEAYDRLFSKMHLDPTGDKEQVKLFDSVYNDIKTYDNLFVYISNDTSDELFGTRFSQDGFDYNSLKDNPLIRSKINRFEMNIIYDFFFEMDSLGISHMVYSPLFTHQPNKDFLKPYLRKDKINKLLKLIQLWIIKD